MWVAYFLPQWLMNHEVKSGKSIDRYKNAMAVVAEQHSITEHKFESDLNIESELKKNISNNLCLNNNINKQNYFVCFFLKDTETLISWLYDNENAVKKITINDILN